MMTNTHMSWVIGGMSLRASTQPKIAIHTIRYTSINCPGKLKLNDELGISVLYGCQKLYDDTGKSRQSFQRYGSPFKLPH